MPALVSRHTEAGVAIDPILAHSPIVARARSTLIVVGLTELSSISSRSDTDRVLGVFMASASMLAGVPSTGIGGGVTGQPAVPRRVHRKPLSPEVFTQVAFSWQGLEKQGSFTSSQPLSKSLSMSEQQLSCGKPLHVELFGQEFKRHLLLFLLQDESKRKYKISRLNLQMVEGKIKEHPFKQIHY